MVDKAKLYGLYETSQSSSEAESVVIEEEEKDGNPIKEVRFQSTIEEILVNE